MHQWYRILALLCALANVGNAQVFWQSDFGPWGGRVNDLCEDNGGNLYAATMEGLYWSWDEGQSWQLHSLEGKALYDVHCTRSGILLAVQDRQLLRSIDGGKNWETSKELSTGVFTHDLGQVSGFFEHSSGALFYGQLSNSYVSTDDGAHWEVFSNSDYSINFWSEAADGTLLTGARLYHWPDRVQYRFPEANLGGKKSTIYLLYATPAATRIAALYQRELFVSLDEGISWERSFVSESLPLDMISSSPSGTVALMSHDFGFLISSDAGRTWSSMARLLPAMKYTYDILCTGHGAWFVACGEGIFRLDHASGTWEACDIRHLSIPVGPLLQLHDQRIIAALPLSDELRERDTQGSWKPLVSGDVPFTTLARSNSGNLLAATDGQGVLISMDGGANWNTTTGGEPTVNALLRLRDGRMLAGGQTGLYESRDDGRNWTRLRSTQDWSIECLLERGNGEIILGGEAGMFIASPDLLAWRAARPSWTPVMRLAEDGSGRLFAGTVGEGLFRSTDGGITWESAGFEGQWITGIVTAGASYCFVATRQEGIFESRDGGGSWNPYSEGLRSNEILDLVPGVDGYLYAGTVRGLSRSALPVLSGGYLTPDFTLEQNTPNPASNIAVFAWSIPREGNVRMSVYDLLGREIAVVLNAIVASGLHWQTVEISELIPGSYFLVLRFEGQMLDRKFQVVR